MLKPNEGEWRGVIGKPNEEEWRGVLGKHGLDERNEAGEQLMQVCVLNQLTVMNTWFEKKRVQYGTWMHPEGVPRD